MYINKKKGYLEAGNRLENLMKTMDLTMDIEQFCSYRRKWKCGRLVPEDGVRPLI